MKRRIQGSSPSLWKTDENWPYQAVPKTWSHMCLWREGFLSFQVQCVYGIAPSSQKSWAFAGAGELEVSPYLDIVTSDIYKHISYLCGNVAMAQSKPCLLWTVVTWSEDQESCIVTQYIGIRMTEGNLWLLKQDLLSTVKNDYGSNWNVINKSIILSWFVFLHIEWRCSLTLTEVMARVLPLK